VTRPEHIGGAPFKLRFPRCDLVGVDVELLRQLNQCSVALDGGKRYLRLECRGVVPACSSAHRLSRFAGQSCPPSGRNSTYRPVQISGTGSIKIDHSSFRIRLWLSLEAQHSTVQSQKQELDRLGSCHRLLRRVRSVGQRQGGRIALAALAEVRHRKERRSSGICALSAPMSE
jgi:hypothetical protein